MKFLSLFAGIGGFDLGLERAGMECVGQVENNPFCLKVLEKHWPHIKRIPDIKDVKGDEFGPVDLICGGYPCQPFSHAGHRRGAEDDRYLWPEMYRLVAELRPAWFIGENVTGHVNMGLDQVLSDLETEGYAARTFVVPACAVDAPHKRSRLWIVAYPGGQQHQGDSPAIGGAPTEKLPATNSQGNRRRQRKQDSGGGETRVGPRQEHRLGNGGGALDNAMRGRYGTQEEEMRSGRDATKHASGWSTEPTVGRVAHGVPSRVDRLRALGNAVVPQIPEIIGRAILEAEKQNNPQSIPKKGSG